MIYDKNRGIIYIIDTITEENMFIDYPKFQHTKRRLYPIVGFFTNNGQRLKPRGNIMECSFKKKKQWRAKPGEVTTSVGN